MTDSIERALGELQGGVAAILRQLEVERSDARESRARVYERVERLEHSIAITGQIAAQARDETSALHKVVHEDVKPQTDRIRNVGLKGGGFLAGAALVGGLVSQPVFSAMADAITKVFKHG